MLSFTLSGKHMSYAYTHLKHKTITNIRIFMHSYIELIQLLKLITNICLKVPVGTTDLYVYGVLTGTTEFILIQSLYGGTHRYYRN